MEEGGICSMYHFNHTYPEPGSDEMRCLVMPSWMSQRAEYAFHFVFYRRLRRFRDPEEEERYRRRRHGRHGRREIGYVRLEAVRSCQEACESDACRPTKECRTLEAGRKIRAKRSSRRN
ncbi:hypothetical protein AAVH_33359 [Aphelenchoides avenae]|nr:hypothetical protein AAVH_33359 [Aphelenchus avenae]